MFLSEVGLDKKSQAVASALNWLKSVQNSDAGWPYDPSSPWGTDSTPDSTAWVISALNKLGENLTDWEKPGTDPITKLSSFQVSIGYFDAGWGENDFTKNTTSYAVLALASKWYPVNKIS